LIRPMPLGTRAEGWRLLRDLLPLPLLFAALCVGGPVAVGEPAPGWAAVGAPLFGRPLLPRTKGPLLVCTEGLLMDAPKTDGR
jgi:hypothetical protein